MPVAVGGEAVSRPHPTGRNYHSMASKKAELDMAIGAAAAGTRRLYFIAERRRGGGAGWHMTARVELDATEARLLLASYDRQWPEYEHEVIMVLGAVVAPGS